MQFFGRLYSQRTFQKGDRLLFEIVNRAGRLIGYQFGVDDGSTIVTSAEQVADFDLDARDAVSKWLAANGVEHLKKEMVEIAMEAQASAQPGTIDAMLDQLGNENLKGQIYSLLKDELTKRGPAPTPAESASEVIAREKVDGGTVLYKGDGKNREFVPDEVYIKETIAQEQALERGEPIPTEDPVAVGGGTSEMGEQIKRATSTHRRKSKSR